MPSTSAEIELTELKEVYAYYGVACAYANLLEQSIIGLIFNLDVLGNLYVENGELKIEKRNIGREEWSDFYDNCFRQLQSQSMGVLKSSLMKLKHKAPKLEQMEKILNICLKRRNYLAHHFYRETFEDFFSTAGKLELIDILRSDQRLFHMASQMLEKINEPIYNQYGLTKDNLKEYVEGLKAAAKKK